MSHSPEYLTVKDLADLMRTTPVGRVHGKARQRGQEPATLAVRVGSRLLWRRADADRWFSKQFAEAGHEPPAS